MEDEDLRKAVGAPVDPRTYIIGAEDILQIRVWREPDLSGPVGVRPDGMISLPLLGDLKAGGLTPEKLAEQIKAATASMSPSGGHCLGRCGQQQEVLSSREVQRPGYIPRVPTKVSQELPSQGGSAIGLTRKKC
jgi:polysaccharide export outer membrane protein